jgi:hypothetical protein
MTMAMNELESMKQSYKKMFNCQEPPRQEKPFSGGHLTQQLSQFKPPPEDERSNSVALDGYDSFSNVSQSKKPPEEMRLNRLNKL